MKDLYDKYLTVPNTALSSHVQVVLLDFGACRGYPEKFTDDYIEVRGRGQQGSTQHDLCTTCL